MICKCGATQYFDEGPWSSKISKRSTTGCFKDLGIYPAVIVAPKNWYYWQEVCVATKQGVLSQNIVLVST